MILGTGWSRKFDFIDNLKGHNGPLDNLKGQNGPGEFELIDNIKGQNGPENLNL